MISQPGGEPEASWVAAAQGRALRADTEEGSDTTQHTNCGDDVQPIATQLVARLPNYSLLPLI